MNWLAEVGWAIVGPFLAGGFAILYGLLIKGIDRKLFAYMQERIGPPIRQPFYDVAKLLWKESIVPESAIPWLFNIMPILSLATSITILLFVPLGPFGPILGRSGDLVVILYLTSLMTLTMVIGAYSSGSPFAAVGSQRLMVLMMGYELPIAVVFMGLGWWYSKVYPSEPSFSLATFARHPIWGTVGPVGAFGILMLLLASMTIGIGQFIVPPFDISIADAEIAGGALSEYSGRNLAMFYLCDAVKLVALGSVIIALFFPYGISGLFGSLPSPVAYTVDFLFYMLKLLLVLFAMVTVIRVTLGRFTVDQVVKVLWGHVTFLALAGLIVLYVGEVVM